MPEWSQVPCLSEVTCSFDNLCYGSKNPEKTAENGTRLVSETPAYPARESRLISESCRAAVNRTLAAESSRAQVRRRTNALRVVQQRLRDLRPQEVVVVLVRAVAQVGEEGIGGQRCGGGRSSARRSGREERPALQDAVDALGGVADFTFYLAMTRSDCDSLPI
jgi:hypothetical protein